MKPRTSVLMPAYNAEETIREAVESVLAQTVAELELIVADDGSRVPVGEVLSDVDDSRLRIVERPQNGGIGRARNSALAVARAPLVSQLDADDLWEPEYLEAVLPAFKDPGIGLVYTNATILGHPDGAEDYIGDASIHPRDQFPELAQSNPLPCPTVTMRTPAVRAVGGYAQRLPVVADWLLYMRLAAAGWRFAFVDQRLARYRWPTPERGTSYDVRSLDRRALAAVTWVAIRHPRLPGVWRAAFQRALHGGEHGQR
jgi:glycosyltransferase involved in cell wall biosynthesis